MAAAEEEAILVSTGIQRDNLGPDRDYILRYEHYMEFGGKSGGGNRRRMKEEFMNFISVKVE